MKQRPISFSPMLIDRIQDGAKTMTRRTNGLNYINKNPESHLYTGMIIDDDMTVMYANFDNAEIDQDDETLPWGTTMANGVDSHYGNVGDLLWIREEHKISMIHKPGQQCETWLCEYRDGTIVEKYAKELPLNTVQQLRKRKTLNKWQRARFLPQAFARLWLEITSLDVERLTKISAADALKEGVFAYGHVPLLFYKNYEGGKDFLYDLDYGSDHENKFQTAPIASFCSLWTSIYGREGWTSDPWVWVISFKKTKQPENHG